jgi:uroporphyrinogen III methyltransferase/synthase
MVVYIVGAGPGDRELVTLKARRLIEEADVILYDKLVNPEILEWASHDCEIINVGKREPHSEQSQHIQSDINDLLVKYGKGKKLVRLKGGDPFIFGRGGEEAQICASNDIPFEIVPGMSSAFAVPAYAGIPVSHRDFNSSFGVITGHESDKDVSAIEWMNLPENIVILMGVGKIKTTAEILIEHGRDPSTPTAGIYSGTTPKQKTVITTLGKLADKGIELEPPVIFVVGPIVALHEELSWFERKLTNVRGKRVLLTRAKGHEKESIRLLEEYGIQVESMPLIEIVPRDFTVPDLNGYDAVVFTSLEGVKRVAVSVDLNSYGGRFYAIGPKTRSYLKENTGNQVSMGEKYNSQGLGEHICSTLERGRRILALRSSAATHALRDLLTPNYTYEELHVYDISPLPADAEKVRQNDVIFVVSATCAKSISELAAPDLAGKTIISIGPETSKNLDMPHLTAREHTIKGMLDTYIEYLWSDPE